MASVVKCNVANWTASHKQGCRKAAAQWSLHKLARDRIVAANIDLQLKMCHCLINDISWQEIE